MKISVVIPCYNAAPWLEQTLTSVAHQHHPPDEVIVVDDGSTDHSLEQLRASSHITHLLQTPHLGPASARNAGIQAASGDWVAFLDADDWWQPDHLGRIQRLMAHSPDSVYLAAAEHYSINVNRIVSMSDTGPFEEPTQHLMPETYFQLYLQHGLLELSACAVQRDRLRAMGGFDPAMRGAEDLDMVLSAIQGHTWSYDPIPTSIYRCNNPSSHSRQFALDESCLTAKFRTFLKHRQAYPVSDAMLSSMARTLMSKAITGCDRPARERVRQLVGPFLPPSQKRIFAIAAIFPGLYGMANTLKNHLKGPKYRPRKVIEPSEGSQ